MGEEETNLAATLIVFHENESDYTSRPIYISIDGAKVGNVKSGDFITLEITPGTHVLQADNTFTKKRESFVASAGERLRYVTRNRIGFGSSLISILGAGPVYLILKREDEPINPKQ